MVKIEIAKRDFVWIGLVLGLVGLSLVYAYGTNDPSVMGHSAGELEIEFSGDGVPSGAVMAFYSTDCPDGWVLANGSAGTPDLRGSFVRGMYGSENGRDVSRSLGSYQADGFAAHSHSVIGYQANPGVGELATGSSANTAQSKSTGSAGGSETRPKNVALTYCMKA